MPAVRYVDAMNTCTRIAGLGAGLSAAAALLLLSGCGDSSKNTPPGEISAGEIHALNDAAEMIQTGRPPNTDTKPAQNADGSTQQPFNTPQTQNAKAPSTGAR